MKLQKHFVRIDEVGYKRKPEGRKIVGRIRNALKTSWTNEAVTIYELLKAFTSGKTVVAAKHEMTFNKALSTSLVLIDIDDESGTIQLETMLELFEGRLSAYYYSFSQAEHNTRLRLIFQLQTEVMKQTHSKIANTLIQEIADEYPQLNISDHIDVKASTQLERMWFGTNKGGVIVDDQARISKVFIDRCAHEVKKERNEKLKQAPRIRFRKRITQEEAYNNGNIPFEDLKAMAQTIGGIPSGVSVEWFNDETVSSYEAWSSLILAIRSYEKEGFITYNEAFQLAEIISGDGLSTKEFDRFNARKEITIATFIKLAVERGYHFNNSYDHDTSTYDLPANIIEAEEKEENKYVPKEFMKEVLQKAQRTLVEAPTGSGKTYATINAMKELASFKDDTVYIMALPMRALASQVAKEYDVPLVIGGVNTKGHELKNLWQSGHRVFAAVYDQVENIMTNTNANELVLVVDEVHFLTVARSYRNDTMQKLIDTSRHAKTFVGISGTTSDVLECDLFDEKYMINANDDIPADSFRVITYSTQINGKTDRRMELLPLVEIIGAQYKEGTKSLVFINNKELIENTAAKLEEKYEGINVLKVQRDDTQKDSDEYKKVVNNDLEGIDVIIATKIIADGINITFNENNWNTIVLSDNRTRTFNPNEVRQMFHRIRSDYKNAILIIREPTRTDDKAKPFHRNRQLKAMHNRAQRIADYFNRNVPDVTEDDLYSVEKRYGLFIDDNSLDIDLNVLNSEVVSMKEVYYGAEKHRELFVNEVAKSIRMKPKVINFNEAAEDNNLLNELLDTIDMEEDEELTPEKQVENFKEFYTESVHTALRNGDIESVFGINAKNKKRLSELCGQGRINAAVHFAKGIKNYEKAKANLIAVTRDNEGQEFKTRLVIRNQFNRWAMRKRRSYTHIIHDKLKPLLEGREFTPSELKEFAKEQAKEHNLKQKDIELVLKYFTAIRREGRSRRNFYRFVPFNVQLEAKQYRLTVEEFNEAAITVLSKKELDKYVKLFEIKRSS